MGREHSNVSRHEREQRFDPVVFVKMTVTTLKGNPHDCYHDHILSLCISRTKMDLRIDSHAVMKDAREVLTIFSHIICSACMLV